MTPPSAAFWKCFRVWFQNWSCECVYLTGAKLAPSQNAGKARAARSMAGPRGSSGGGLDGVALAAALCRMLFSGASVGRMLLLVIIFSGMVGGLLMLPLEQMLKDFLIWLKHGVGPWGPLIMAAAYIPLTVLALPGSILTLGGGYVFGLTVGFAADSIGSTAGATAAFLVGKTIGRSYVAGKLRDFPQFQAIASAISKSGFKIVLLLRLVPILPFNVMNYLLSVTPIPIGSFVLASWVGMMPITFVFVYIGTTIKDISEIGSPGGTMGASQWWLLGLGLLTTVVATIGITIVAKDELQKAIDEHETNKDDDVKGGGDEELGRHRGMNGMAMDGGTLSPVLDMRKSILRLEMSNGSLEQGEDDHQ